MIRFWVAGGVLFALTMAALSLHVPGALGVGSPSLKTLFVVLTGSSSAVYLLAVWLVTHRAAQPRAVWVVLLVAVAMRLPLLPAPPFLSTDIYRYVWDGRVQASGVNPYRYLPADPALASLRDAAVYPWINRAEYAPTIYAPAAEMLFAVAGYVWASVTGFKAVIVLFEILAVGCLLRMLRAAALPAERVLIYAWNPLPVWAFAGNGHIDCAATGLVALALLLRIRHRDTWAGVTLGLAILTKFLPAVVAPVLWRRGAGWRTAGAAFVTIAILYAAYSSVGVGVFGFLGGYNDEEGYASGGGFWLLSALSRLTPLTQVIVIAYKVAAVVLLAGLGAWIALVRRPDDAVSVCAAAAVMMAVLTFAISPHYPWYFAWLAVPAVVVPAPALVWLSAAPMLMYLDVSGDRLGWLSLVYVPALALAACGLRRASRLTVVKGIA